VRDPQAPMKLRDDVARELYVGDRHPWNLVP
jgi:hypothetical protein